MWRFGADQTIQYGMNNCDETVEKFKKATIMKFSRTIFQRVGGGSDWDCAHGQAFWVDDAVLSYPG